MEEKKVLSALCYFSIFFLPVLFPMIVWAVGEEEAKSHAKKALVLHFAPIFFFFAGIAAYYITATIHGGGELDSFLFFGIIISISISVFPILIFFGLNIVRGVQVFLDRNGH